MDVRFGVHAGLQNTSIAELQGLWRRIEELGFDWISVWDHFYAADATGNPHCLEAITTHTALAATTERVQVRFARLLRRLPASRRARQRDGDPRPGRERSGRARTRRRMAATGVRRLRDPVRNARRAATQARRVHPVRARAAHPGAHDVRRRVLHVARRAVRTQARAGAAADLDRWRRREGDAAHLRASTPTGGTCRSSRPTPGRTRREVLDEHCERVGRDPATITKTVNVGMAFTDEELRAPVRRDGELREARRALGQRAGDGRQGRRRTSTPGRPG